MYRSDSKPRALNTLLFLLILILANLILFSLDLRIDMTANDRYSLSPATEQMLLGLDDTIRARLYFSDAVPPPHDTIPRYAENLMRAYERRSDAFSFSRSDLSQEDVREEAERLGVQPIQLQRTSGERQETQRVYLGIVLDYGGLVETVSPLRGEQGMEYRITAAIESLQRRRQAMRGEEVDVQFFRSPNLEELQIQSLPLLQQLAEGVFETVAQSTGLTYSFTVVEPESEEELDWARQTYGLPRVNWRSGDGSEERSILGFVVENDEGFEAIPIRIIRAEDGYAVQGVQQLPALLQRSIDNLLGVLPQIGYTVGNGEPSLFDQEQGAGLFRAILSERYRFVPQNIAVRPVDAGIDLLVINGPQQRYSPEALANIEGFLENGGSLMAFVDPYTIPPDAAEDDRDPWVRNVPALRDLLRRYGIDISEEIVLDAQNYVGTRGEEQRPLFQAPQLRGEGLNRSSPITRELENVILFNPARTEPTGSEQAATVLLRSSPNSWATDAIHRVGPWIEQVPPTAELTSYPLGILAATGNGGHILTVGTSAITSPPLLAAQDKLANRVFLQNSADYLSGAPGFALLRSKGLSEPRLPLIPDSTRFLVRLLNAVVPPLLLISLGVGLFLIRKSHQRRLRLRYQEGKRR